MKQPDKAKLYATLKSRFEKHKGRHKGLDWSIVEARQEANPKKLQTLLAMEDTGGEPDVIGYDKKTGQVTFCDCSPESPKDRRSLCYDRKALMRLEERRCVAN